MQSGQPPTVLQQLCLLPFQYFSDPALTNVLFPTLIACCYRSHGNKEILEQELSCELLANFIEVGQGPMCSEVTTMKPVLCIYIFIYRYHIDIMMGLLPF